MATGTEKLQIVIGAKDEATSVLGRIQNSIVGIGTAYLSWQGAKKIIDWTVASAVEAEKVWAGVAQSITLSGQSADATMPRIQSFAKNIMAATGQTDESIGQVIESLTRFGMNASTAMRTASVAVDLAAGKHMDLLTAANLLGKAYKGHTETLSRYGIIIDETSGKAKDFASVLDAVKQATQGAADAAAATAAGQWQRVKEQFAEMAEEAGTHLLPALTKVMAQFNYQETVLEARQNGLWDSWRKLLAVQNVSLDDTQKAVEVYHRMVSEMIAADQGVDDFTNSMIGLSTATNTSRESSESWVRQAGIGTNSVTKAVEIIINQNKALADSAAETSRVFNQMVDDIINSSRRAPTVDVQAYMSNLEISTAIQTGKRVEQVHQGVRDADWRGWVKFFNNKALMEIATSKKAAAQHSAVVLDMADSFVNGMARAGATAGNAMYRVFMGEKVKLAEVWQGMAADFLGYFMEGVMAGIAGRFAGKLLNLIGFDNPKNDAMAFNSGLDYAKFFSGGVMQGIQSIGVPAMAFSGASSRSSSSGFNQSAGTGNINIHFHGPVTSREFVRREIIPAIEQAATGKFSRLKVSTGNLTGRPQVEY
ncbi:MAG: hypothetical protein WC455_12225 [Dehalococcoidia bacterium]|jgi:hypothetical protein